MTGDKNRKLEVWDREAIKLLHSDKKNLEKLVWGGFHYIQRSCLRAGIIFSQ